MQRLDLKVGFKCNLRCKHCVQGDKRSYVKSKTFQEIKDDLGEAISKGIKEVVFTGGEPTVHPDIIESVRFAKELGYRIIQIQTNGRMFASENFTRKMIDAGMTSFGPALNGHIPALHDYLASVPGAWKQTVKGILNVKKYEIPIVMNTVVSKPNYRFLDKLANLFIKLKVDQFQMAFVHILGSAKKNWESIVPRVSLAAPHIHQALKIGNDAGLGVMAEAMPFCVMKGYEKFVSEFYIPSSVVYSVGFRNEDFDKWRITEGKWKGEKCRECAYSEICEGPWKEYVELFGSDEFIPISGKKITKNDIFNERVC